MREDPAILAELSTMAQGLARRLDKAGRIDRLLGLFGDDRRAARRFDRETGAWDGYQDDLEVAWDALDRRLAAPEEDAADLVPDLLRIALVRATLSSADEVPPALVAAAVRTGCWTVRRAAATIDRHPTSGHRGQMLSGLLRAMSTDDDLWGPLVAQLAELAFLPSPDLPAEALLSGLDLLEPPERLAVVDRIATDVAVLPTGAPFAPVAGPRVLAETAVLAIETVPEAGRPVFLAKVADSLLDNFTPSAPTRPEQASDRQKSLWELSLQHVGETTFDPRPAFAQAAELLARLAGFLPALPTGQRLAERLAAVVARVPDQERRDSLVRAFETAFPDGGLVWPADEPEDSAAEDVALPDDERRPVETDDDEGPPAWFVAEMRRSVGPVLAGFAAEAQGLPDEVLYRFVREAAAPQDLVTQLFALPAAPVSRKIRAGLLIAALDHHFRRGTLRAAWHGVAPQCLVDVEWNAVLTFVLTLPAEEERTALHLAYGEQREARHLVDGSNHAADAERIPRLAALRLTLPYLTEEQVGIAFTNLISLTDPWTLRLALEMLAPRLDTAQVAQGLRELRAGGDAREQVWFLLELVRGLDPADPRRQRIMRWSLDAIAAMRTGADLGLFTATEDLPVEQILDALRAVDDNNRTDAFLAIARATSGPLPAEIVEESLLLPVLNATGHYSPRCEVIASIADRFPDETVEAAFHAAMELPRRLDIGDSQLWGWNWGYEYPLGSALRELAPRLRGESAEAAFTACRDLPWIAREDVLEQLAAQADGPLAAALFDYSIAIHDQYLNLPDSAPAGHPLEGTVVTEPISHFKLNHEVHLAEMIAATASKLDPSRLRQAVAQAQALRAGGPNAWLPARLLPFLDEDQREPLLSGAVIAALEFVGHDPSRLDLVTDLLPGMHAEISRRREPLDRFLGQRFDGRHDLLTEEEFHVLSEKDGQEYLHLTGADLLAEMRTLIEAGDGAGVRAMLIKVMLSPLYAENLQQALTGMLTGAPLRTRIDALENMKEILQPGAHASVVRMALQQVVDGELEPMDRVRHLAALLPHLDQDTRDGLVAVASRLPGPQIEDERERRSAFLLLTLKEFEKPLMRDRRFDEFRHSSTMQLIRRGISDHDSSPLQQHRTARVPLLDALGPTLSEAGVALAVELVRGMSDEMERAGGVAALLPVATGESRGILRSVLTGLTSPFARWLVLFTSMETLRADEDPTLTEFARSTAEDFLEPKEVAVFLLLLIDYAHDERREWIGRALALAGTLPVDDRLKIMAIAAQHGKTDPGLARMVADHVCALPTPASVHDGWTMATRMGIGGASLTDAQLSQVRLAESAHLRAAARRGRAELLRTLAETSGAIAELTTSEGVLDIAQAVRDICVEWHWPSAV
ncbi:hypothetical protein ACFQ05_19810 [Amycolatopsis umgeniensis]|uniref:Uncharacterized protein n=1 Tax=Amycolatopsis umgeniensis TaxID=336628 RepID=A0A841BAH3_9PSEU|nr:hypothetical protein [Amycolatopsis umgeniensis]MBB5857859.1 hypothetical protein [Amycolatopsis umgeniensis]